jgi:tRNA pseudouridine38-40 synthase
MDTSAKKLVGMHDFVEFAKRRRELDSTVCTVLRARWQKWSAGRKFVIEADRFLPGMIRKMVGVMVWIGLSKLDPDEIMLMMSGHKLRSAVPMAPAHGLYLEKVRYEGFCYEPTV